jgi:hypothetical protein
MIRCSRSLAKLVALSALLLSGCGWFGGDEEDLDFDDGFAELGISADLGSDASAAADSTPIQDGRFRLNVNVGDRYPLTKSIEQVLTQTLAHGPVVSRSKLQLQLTLSVEEVRDGKTRLGVRYDRVQYEHDLAGERVHYDSRNAGADAPPAARVYRGFLNNGFSFWMGPNNKVLELVGFQAFLERCVRDLPYEERHAIAAGLSPGSGDDEIANFIDDSLGLLPSPEETVRVGNSWTTRRQVVRPLPMYLNNECLLESLNDRVAEISIRGTVAPSVNFASPEQAGRNVRLMVRGGHTIGNCTIDRATGLPVSSRIERNLDIVVNVSDGSGFEQTKKVVTTIQALPQDAASGANEYSVPSGANYGRLDSPQFGNSAVHADATTNTPAPGSVSRASYGELGR